MLAGKAGLATLTIAALAVAGFSATALAGDIEAGKAKADVCLECHFEDDFAGMSAAEIEVLIREGREGVFEHEADEIRELPEEDIADVAAWFAHEGAQ